MCFCDIDHQELDAIAEFVVELVEGGNLPPEGRSGITAEDQHDGALLSGEGTELDMVALV